MKKPRHYPEQESACKDQDCLEQDFPQNLTKQYRFDPRHMFGSQAERFKRHYPENWRSNRRVIFFFGLVFSLITILVVSGVVALVLQIIQIPDMMHHSSMMEDGFRRFIPFFIFLLIIGALVATGRYSRKRFSNPLEKILNAADSITEGDLTTRIEGIGHGPFYQVQIALNRMVEELERSDQLRRDQTADIAHELNTPIHIIRGYLEGISDGIYNADEEMLSLLMEETSLLTRLVDDLRLLSLADAGRLPIHPEQVNLKDVLEDIQVSFLGQANEEKIDFLLDAKDDVIIGADSSHIYRIVNNLVSNALSYTDAGGKLVISLDKEIDSAMLTIADTGQGMNEEDISHAFDRFWRKDKSRQRKDGGGYGLGLAIVQQLVIANGGTIDLQSELGNGTIFTLRFPFSDN